MFCRLCFNCFNSAANFDVIDDFTNIKVRGFAIDFGDTNNSFANISARGFTIDFDVIHNAFANI